MSRQIDDLETVVRTLIALEPEDLERHERKAFIRIAHDVDKTLNAQTTSNPRADETYETPSRLARAAGCDKADCKICTRDPRTRR